MKSLEELAAIVDILIRAKLPKEQILFMNSKEKRETDLWLKKITSTGVVSATLPKSDIECDTIIYGGYTFRLVDTGYCDEEPHLHNWVENKTYLGDTGSYVLSHYCKECGRTETYHGKEQRWIETGNLKDCNKLNECR